MRPPRRASGDDGSAPKAKVYDTQRERDEALEASYQRDQAAVEIVGDEAAMHSTLAAVSSRATDFAEDFWQHRHGLGDQSIEDALLRYEARRFGRQLEPAGHWILAREVARRIQGGRRMAAGLFVSRAEEQHWTNCAIEAGGEPESGEGALEFVERVCDLATGRRRMAPAEIEARREELRRQALLIGAGAPGGIA